MSTDEMDCVFRYDDSDSGRVVTEMQYPTRKPTRTYTVHRVKPNGERVAVDVEVFSNLNADGHRPDPFAMSPEQEAEWEAQVAKREAEQKAKEDAEAAEQRQWDRSWKILIGLLWLQIVFATVHLVAISLR